MELSPGKDEMGSEGKGGLSLLGLTLIGGAKVNISGIFLALLWKMAPAGDMDKLPIRVRNAKGKYPEKVIPCSYAMENIVHSSVRPIMKMKGRSPSRLPSRDMVSIPSLW